MSFIETPEGVAVTDVEKPGLAERLRRQAAEYPRPIWVLAASIMALWAGRGMVTPFLVIYFSQIVGLNASLVGTGIAGAGLAGVAFVLLVAPQIDRHGGKPVLLITVGAIALATFLSAWAHSAVTFLLVALLLFVASQSYWPSIDTVVTSIAYGDKVIPSMALIRVAMAVGIGLGGLFGGLMVAGGGLPEYRMLFITSAALIAAGGVIIWRAVPRVAPTPVSDSGARGSWRDVTADRTFIYGLVVLFSLVLGFTQMQMSVPPFLRAEAGVGEGAIGTLFFMNTVLIVLAQVPVAARVDRGNVGRLLAISSVIWSIAFLAMIATPGLPLAAIFVFLAFTSGQLIFTPLTAIIAVRLSPAHLRGRYFSLLSITWGSSWAIATLTAGIALDLSRPILLWPVMSLLMLAGAVAALRLRREARLRAPAVSAVPSPSD